MLGKQRRERAEGLAACGLAGAAVNAWTDQGDGAESGAEQKAAASFALKVPTTLLAAPMSRQETRRLGCNEVYLRAGQYGLGHCHGNGGAPSAMTIVYVDAADLVRPSPVPARRHPARGVALSPLHAELSGRGGPAGRA